jgi:hypothetical protein
MNEEKSKLKIYVLIFSVALAIRIIMILLAYNLGNSYLSSDSHDYIRLADGIISNHIYGINQPEIFRVPGYPVIISFFILIFNKFFLISLLIFQAIVDSLTCILVYKLSNLIFWNNKASNKSSILASLFQVISILAIVYTSKILSETIFTFLVILTLFLLQRLVTKLKYEKQKIRYRSIIIISFLSSILCYIRFIFFPLSIFLIIIVYCFSRKIRILILGIIIIIGCIGIWCIRNYEVANYPGFSSVSNILLYRYNACAVESVKNNRSYDTQQKIFDANLKKYPSQAKQAEFSKNHGMKILTENPVLYLNLHLRGDVKTLFPAIGELYKMLGYKIGSSGTLAIINSKGLYAGVKHYFSGNLHLFFYAIPVIIFLFLKYLAFLLAFIYIFFTKNNTGNGKLMHLIYLIIILYFLLIPGPAATPRFRVPVESLLNIYSAFGFILLFNKIIYSKIKKKLVS